jgi:hypothetical protein
MSEDHEQQQERRRLKNQTKALYQAQRRANPVVRSLERSSDTGRRRIAREEPGVQERRRSTRILRRKSTILCNGIRYLVAKGIPLLPHRNRLRDGFRYLV